MGSLRDPAPTGALIKRWTVFADMAPAAGHLARRAAAFGAGLVLIVLGIAEIVRIFEEGSVPAIRWFRGLLFLATGIALALWGHVALRQAA